MEEKKNRKRSSSLRLRFSLLRSRASPEDSEDQSKSEDSVESDDSHVSTSDGGVTEVDSMEVLLEKDAKDEDQRQLAKDGEKESRKLA